MRGFLGRWAYTTAWYSLAATVIFGVRLLWT